MLQLILTDESWSKLMPIIRDSGVYFKPNLRFIIEGILWKLRTGAPWRDLPGCFGPWSTVYNQFNRWSAKGRWLYIFKSIRGELDNEWNFADGTIVSAHQHASGARKNSDNAIGKSRSGNTTKVHMLADAHGNPIDFEVTGGQVHDSQTGANLIAISEAESFIADKAYDSELLRLQAQDKQMQTVIPRRSHSTKTDDHDRYLYKLRHLIENLFARLKHFRSVATRYEKLKRNYEAIVFISCTLVWLKL